MALPTSRVITLIDIGLGVNEHYVQFVPPATFGVIYDSALKTIQLVRADGQQTQLRKTADKIYTLRGFLGLRRRECRGLELRWGIEDEIIRCVLTSFGSPEKLKAAVWKYCPNSENAEVIIQRWSAEVFDVIDSDEVQQDHASAPSPTELDMSLSGPAHIPPITHVEEHDFANLGVFPAVPYMEGSSASFGPTSDSESPHLTKLLKRGDKEMDFCPTTSLQEFEEFTLPLVSSLPVSSQTETPTTFMSDTRSLDITTRQTQEPQAFPAYNQNIPPPSYYRGLDYSTSRLRRLPLPIAALFPSQRYRWMASTPVPLQSLPEQTEALSKMTLIPPPETEDEIHKEIQTLTSLEVLRTRSVLLRGQFDRRCPSSDRKIEMASSLISRLGLPEDYFIVGKCYRAIDTAIDDCVRSMKEYFLREGSPQTARV